MKRENNQKVLANISSRLIHLSGSHKLLPQDHVTNLLTGLGMASGSRRLGGSG